MTTNLDTFSEVWLVNFEFHAPAGERPVPICMVARELRTGRTLKLWGDDLLAQRIPPYPLGPEALMVAFYASSELGCHLALGWLMPARILDLFAEFRCRTSGLDVPCGNNLLGAMTYFGLDGIGSAERKSMRQLAARGGPFTDAERTALLE